MLVDARELINTDIIRRLIKGTGGYVYTSNISSYISSYVTSIVGGAALQGSGAYTQNTGTIQFANSNGLSFGLTNGYTWVSSTNGVSTTMYLSLAHTA